MALQYIKRRRRYRLSCVHTSKHPDSHVHACIQTDTQACKTCRLTATSQRGTGQAGELANGGPVALKARQKRGLNFRQRNRPQPCSRARNHERCVRVLLREVAQEVHQSCVDLAAQHGGRCNEGGRRMRADARHRSARCSKTLLKSSGPLLSPKRIPHRNMAPTWAWAPFEPMQQDGETSSHRGGANRRPPTPRKGRD